MKASTSSDLRNLSGQELELMKTHMATMKNKNRVKLLQLLLDKKLSTRDIFSFARGQADRRQYNKFPDWGTIEPAMVAKLSDAKQSLRESYIQRSKKKLQVRSEFEGKSYRFNKRMRQIRAIFVLRKTN